MTQGRRRHIPALAVLLGLAAVPVAAQDDQPLSAIDWLSDSVEAPQPVAEPVPGTRANRTPDPSEPPVSGDATIPPVSVQPLDGPSPDPVGLLPEEVTGLPRTLWSGSEEDLLVALIAAEQVQTLPALQDLMRMLLLAEADPPLGSGPDGALFLARVDKLLDHGALEQAQALLEAARPETPTLFRRYFDVALLTGTEDRACRIMEDRPAVAPTAVARIFCLARAGDWSAAALTLNTGTVLGDIDPATADLMARFLDPDLFEGEAALPPPARVTPLEFRLREAIGEPLATTSLPRAFAHADLRDTTGWKAQLEAGERLVRTGALDGAVLLDAYTSRVPAASGGVWERAKAVQRLESALEAGDTDRIATALGTAWEEFGAVQLRVALADWFGPALAETPLPGTAEDTRYQLLMLTRDYETAALDIEPPRGRALLGAIARGSVPEDLSPTPRTAAIHSAFAAPAPDETLVTMAASGRLGEAILRTIATLDQGLAGDDAALAEGLSTLRALGLEDAARRIALQHLILRGP